MRVLEPKVVGRWGRGTATPETPPRRRPFKVTAGGRWEETQCGEAAARSSVLASLLERQAEEKQAGPSRP